MYCSCFYDTTGDRFTGGLKYRNLNIPGANLHWEVFYHMSPSGIWCHALSLTVCTVFLRNFYRWWNCWFPSVTSCFRQAQETNSLMSTGSQVTKGFYRQFVILGQSGIRSNVSWKVKDSDMISRQMFAWDESRRLACSRRSVRKTMLNN